jgi:hypothetical protein
MMRRRGRKRRQLMENFRERRGKMEIEVGNTISHSVENSLRKRLWTCRKADCEMNEMNECG